jgi:hypothetical protein
MRPETIFIGPHHERILLDTRTTRFAGVPLRRFGTSAIVYNSSARRDHAFHLRDDVHRLSVHSTGQFAAGAAAQHDCPVGQAGRPERRSKSDRHRENRHQHRHDAGNAHDDHRRRAEARRDIAQIHERDFADLAEHQRSLNASTMRQTPRGQRGHCADDETQHHGNGETRDDRLPDDFEAGEMSDAARYTGREKRGDAGDRSRRRPRTAPARPARVTTPAHR